MKSRLVVLTALLTALVAVGLAIARVVAFTPTKPPVAHASLPPRPTSYLGVFEDGVPPSYEPVAQFARMAGKTPNLVGYYSGWTQSFPLTFAREISAHGVTPYVQIDPTFASVKGIAAGDYDRYLRAYAASVRAFGHSVVIGFAHEMNAPWYQWGYTRLPAATFIAAWRHIVTLFDHQGAQNVTWLWTINSDRPGTGPIQSWWPGSKYVTWIGVDGYYFRPSDTFAGVFGHTIDQVRKFTRKPVLLSETAVGPAAGQFTKIENLFNGMGQYKTLGLVWFDKDRHGSIFRQDWRIEGNAVAQAVFRLNVSSLNLRQ
jgi:mannan endo-1,4-beta-mannosidase